MNDEQLKKAYQSATKYYNLPDFETFKKDMQDENNLKRFRDNLSKHYNVPDFNTFKSDMGVVKKKETTVLPSEQKSKPISSGTQPKVTQKPSATSVSQKESKPEILFPAQKGKRNDIFTAEDGKTYRLDTSSGRPVWKGYTSNVVKGQGGSKQDYEIYNSEITDPATVGFLNKSFNKKASTSEAEQVFTGYTGKEENEYRIRNNVWQRKQKGQDDWTDLYSQGSISALNKEFGQKVKYDAARDKFSGASEDVQLKEKKYLDQNINSINSKLIGNEEKEVVDNLRKKFPGFTFNQEGTFTDEIKVQAPNKEITYISLDNWTDDDDNAQAQKLRGFIRTNSSKELASATSSLEETEKENEIKSGININMRKAKPGDREYISGVAENMQPFVQDVSFVSKEEKYKTEAAEKVARKEYAKQTSLVFADVYDRQKQSLKEGSKINDKEVVAELAALPKSNDAIRRANEYANDVNKSFKSYNSKIEELSKFSNDINQKLQSGEISEEEFNQVYKPQIETMSNDIKTTGENLKIDATNLTNVDRAVNESVASQYIIDESQGSFGGGIAYKFVKGLTYIPRLISPEMDAKGQEELVRTIVGGGTTKEYMESENRNDIAKTLFSLSESMGALASGAVLGGGPATYAAFYGQSYYEMKDDLDQVEGMSDASKVLMSAGYGALSSVLEKFGVDFAMQKTGVGKNLTNSIMKAVFSDLPKNASKEFIEASIVNNAKRFLIQSGIQTAGSGAVEGATEGLQALTQVGIKEVYDLAKGTDYFNNKSGWDILSDIAYESYLGALGGGIMGTVSQGKSVIDRGVNVALNKDQINVLFNSAKIDGIPEALLTNLKSSIITGKISQKEAQDIYNSYSEVKSKIQSIPEEYSIDNKSVALDLMLEKDRINKQIAGKDANLVKPQTDRIAEIDNQLKTIGENAVKESTVEEVTAEGGGIQREGTQEGQPEVGQGEGAVGQAAQQGTDLGNRSIESRSEEEVDKLIEDRIAKYNLQPDDLFADMSEADNNIIEKASRGDSVDSNALNGTIDYLYNKYKEIINLKKNNEERLNKSTTLGNLNDIQQKIENDLDFLITYKGEVEQGNNPITIEEFNSRPITERKVSTEEVSQDIAPTQPTAVEESVVNVEETAKALDGVKFNADFNLPLEQSQNSTQVAEAYIKAKQDGSNPELVKAVENIISKQATVAEESVVEQPAAEEVERLGKLLEGTDQQIDEQVGGLRVSKSNNKVAQSIANAAKAIAKILPDVKFVVHDTDESYRKATGEQGRSQSSSGEYNNKTKTININASKANNRTAAHEVFHAILLNKIGSDIELQRLTKAMIDSVLKSLSKTKGSEEVVAYLEKFASQYDDKTIFNEEKLAELFGILADNYAKLPADTKNIIQRFIDRVRKILGLKPMTDREVIDFMNTISQKVASGQEITQKDISKISTDNTISKVNKRFQADFSDSVSKLSFIYDKNGEQFKKLEKDGFITRDKSLSDFNGKYIFLHQPDAAFSGMIFKDGEVLVEGKGGVFYPIKFHEDGYFWASTDRTAKKMADDLNKVMEQNGGSIYMALTSAPSDKLMSSTTMANAILDFFSSKALDKNFKVTPTQLKSALRKAANDVKSVNNKKVGLDLKLPSNATIEEMQSAIRTALGSENSSFADRKNFAVELTKLMASEINKNDIAVNQFGKLFSEGIQNKYFKGITKTGKLKISAANMTQALSEMFTEPMLKEGIDREKGGQVYAILELNGPVKAEPSTKHESYPMAIESANKDNKVTLHLLNDRQNWFDTFEDFETGDIVSKERQLKVYPTSGVSVRGLRVNTYNVSPRKQLVAPNGKPSNLNEKQWNQVRTTEFKKWFGNWENDPENASKVVDENGEPLVVYHGTRKSFDEFSYDVKPANFRAGALEYSFWFTANKKNSELYGDQVMEVFLNSRNPIEIDYTNPESYREVVAPADKTRAMSIAEFNEKKGNIKHSQMKKGIELRMSEDKTIDGIIHKNIKDIILSDNFQVFNPTQVKSATENVGTFSELDKSIRKQKADTISGIVFTARQNGFSDAAISQYLLGKGYTQEQIDSALSAKAGTKNIDDIFEASEQEIRDKVKRKSIREFFRALTRTTLNRQVDIKRALAGLKNKQAQKALSRLITKAGASGLASIRFKIAAKDIYGKLKEADIKILDRIIYARRIISINENRAMKGLEPYRGMSGYSEVNAQQDLNDIKNEIGEEKFNDLNERAGKYFDVFKKNLKKLKDSGRISEEVYNDLNEIEYSPIATIKYIISDNIDVTDMDREASRLGISKEDIKKLTDRNENGIITDSRYLLAMNISSVESRAFENAMLNEVVKALDEATPEQQVALSEYIVFDNPIIGSFKDGRPKRKYDDQAVPNGFKKVYYFENGIEKYIIVREDMARQLLDVKNSKVQAAIENTAKTVPVVGTALKTITLTPARLLRFFATGGNPLFILGNVAVDWVNAVFNTDVYSNLKAYGMVQAGLGFAKNFIKKAVTSDTFNKTYNEFAEHGGLMDFLSNESMRALNELKPGHKIFSPLHKVVEMYGTVMSFLGETSEVAMRLAVYEKMKSNLVSEFKKENGVDPNAQQMDDIMWEAAREARELIDFNQGGSWAKEADVVMPYLNAALQGFRKPLEYAKKNPVGFASSYIQLAGMGASIAAMSLAAAMNAMPSDDDDEEKKKKIRKALDSISDHEKASYHIIFTGKVDKNGELEYIRIKKLPVASVATTLAEQMMYKYLVDYKFDEATFDQTIEKSLPFSISELESKNPVVSGFITYKYNEDTFTGEEVFRGPKDKVILKTAEGINDPKIESFYKSVASALGLSPARSKAFVEKIITNQSTNPTINIFYAAANGIFGKDTQFGTEFSTAMEKMKEAAGKKLIRYTNENVLKYKKEDELEKEKIYITTEKYLKDSKIKADIKDRYNNGKTMTIGELEKIVKENYDPIDQQKYLKKYYTYTQTMNADPTLLDLLYEDDPNIQALIINDTYGPSLEKQELDELIDVMQKSGRKVSNKAWYIYEQKYKNRK